MSDRSAYRRSLGIVLAAALTVRIVIAFTSTQTSDIAWFRHAIDSFDRWGVEFYRYANFDPAQPWNFRSFSYPPGYLPWLAAAVRVDRLWGFPFWKIVRIAPIVADMTLAWIAQSYLGRRGARDGQRLLAAALILFCPTFVATSALEGQIDPVAIVPAVIAAVIWERELVRRGLVAGALIGVGASIKTIPILMVLALLPTSRNRREVSELVASALLVPALATLPFFLADPSAVARTLQYGGFPGAGGLNVLVEPTLVEDYIRDSGQVLSGASELLQQMGWGLTAGAVGAVTIINFRRRAPAVEAAVLLWLAVYVTSTNWYPQYVAWGLPFFVMAGHLWAVTVANILLLPIVVLALPDRMPPQVLPDLSVVWRVYWAFVVSLWALAVVGLVQTLRRVAGDARIPIAADPKL